MTFYIVGRTGTQIEAIADIIKNFHETDHILIPTNDVACVELKQEGNRDIFFVYIKIPTTTAWDRVVATKDENGRLINGKIDDLMQSKFVDDQISFVNNKFEQYADYTIDESEMLVSTAYAVWDFIRKCEGTDNGN